MHTMDDPYLGGFVVQTDLADCHGNLEAKETELEAVRGDLERSQATMEQNRAEVEPLQAELGRVSASEEKLTQRLSAKDKKLLASEERLSEEREKGTRRMQLVGPLFLTSLKWQFLQCVVCNCLSMPKLRHIALQTLKCGTRDVASYLESQELSHR
jgi:hypothetical protein